ncbi:MAG: response regulator [Verrucomicrobiales bacterium]|nr:response regulator [Verrucomicrobiales bacterium]
MTVQAPDYTILLVEDDENDAFLFKRALKKCNLLNPIHWVPDGAEAIAYLTGGAAYVDRTAFPFPGLIVLDLKMPRMPGLDLLAWLRDHRDLQVIPTIVMSSSKHDSDVRQAYELGANTYFVKPSNFDMLARVIQTLHEYWTLSTKPQRKAGTNQP